MKYFIDSSAWIEYLSGSLSGERVFGILKKEDVYSLNLIVAEVVSKVKREKRDFNLAFRIMTSNSKLLNINPEIAKIAGILHADMKKKKRDFGLVDAIIWAVAEQLNAKLITCDSHFKNFKNILLLN